MKQNIIFLVFVCAFLLTLPLKSSALTVSPPKFEFSADPGEVLNGKIGLLNNSDQPMTLYASFERVESKGSYGEPIFTREVTGLASWIEVEPQQITLEPGASQEAQFTIKVPENAPPGGHYAAIFWGTKPPDKKTGISVGSRIAVLVLLNVSGDVVESGEVTEFRANKRVFSSLPIGFSYSLRNSGTVYLKPSGELAVFNIFGQSKAALTANPLNFNVLPGTNRFFEIIWQKEGAAEQEYGKGFFSGLKREKENFALGWFRAVLTVEFGGTGRAEEEFSFFVLPWRIITISLIAALLLIGLFILLLKRYNRWIIQKAQAKTKGSKRR